MKLFKVSLVLMATCTLTGCFELQGVHVLNHFGESDQGMYSFSMNSAAYAALDESQKQEMLTAAQRWSMPQTGVQDGSFYMEDLSGTAAMEHFYDHFSCAPAPMNGFMDCSFAFEVPADAGWLPNWSIDWEVWVRPGTTVLRSNHHSTHSQDGLQHLAWQFDGNRVSEARVEFAVRAPIAR